MSHLENARNLPWYCELCERMHPLGEHDPGKEWPPLAAPPPARKPLSPDGPDLYRCHCGIHLFATAERARPEAWARHVAHMEAFANGDST